MPTYDPARDESQEHNRIAYRLAVVRKARECEREKVAFDMDAFPPEPPTHCPALGHRIWFTTPMFRDHKATFDRALPGAGYTKGNVNIISAVANRVKSDADPHSILRVAHWAYTVPNGLCHDPIHRLLAAALAQPNPTPALRRAIADMRTVLAGGDIAHPSQLPTHAPEPL